MFIRTLTLNKQDVWGSGDGVFTGRLHASLRFAAGRSRIVMQRKSLFPFNKRTC